MTSITPATLAQRLHDGTPPVVLDIRGEEEFEDWHVPDSTNIDVYDELRDDATAAKEALRELPSEDEIVTICGIGIVSQTATELLQEMGYEAKTLEEGMVGWSQVHRWAPVPLEMPGTLVQVARPGKGCLSYILISDGQAAVFDPSQYVSEYTAVIDDFDAELVSVYETHAHADHLSGGPQLAEEYDVPYHLHADDAIAVGAIPIEDADIFRVGEISVELLPTPGHSPGSVTYNIHDRALLTGDTLFHESVGRVELGAAVGLADSDVERNAERLYESIHRLIERGDDPLVLPAHDPGSPNPPVTATVEDIKQRNSDVKLDKSEFVAELASDVPELPPNVRQIKLANVGLEEIDTADRTSIELGPNRCAAE